MRTYLTYISLIVAATVVWGCDRKPESKEKPKSPAKVQNAVKETDLTTITLTPEAESRLGIELAPVEYRSVERNRTFGGEVVPIPGRAVTVSAPLSGTVLPPESEPAIEAGQYVTDGQPLYRLLLALPEQDMLSVQEEASLRQTEFDLAKARVERARQLLSDKAGSIRDLEEADAQLAKAKASFETARTRLELLIGGELDSARGVLSSLIIKSPISGIVQGVHVAPSQTVTSTTALVEVAGIDPVWIKVPVYVGDISRIDPNKPAQIHSLDDFAGAATDTAQRITAPLSADADSVTADIFYELSNPNHSYRPGQKVSVTLALTDAEQNLVVPYSAILYDMYGGTWMYQNTEPHIYVRRRVELRHVLDELAVLSRGPVEGARVVIAGAAELFGTEFGVGK